MPVVARFHRIKTDSQQAVAYLHCLDSNIVSRGRGDRAQIAFSTIVRNALCLRQHNERDSRFRKESSNGLVVTVRIQRETDGFFEEIVDQVAEDYPSVEYRRELFDALLASLIMHPERYGVIVTPNEYGDFLSDAACGLIGSVGIGDSASYAFDDEGRVELAMFDPAGGSAPDIAGEDVANPCAALLAMANMLGHIGERTASTALRDGLMAAMAEGCKTRDIGGDMGTRTFTAEVIERMKARLAAG